PGARARGCAMRDPRRFRRFVIPLVVLLLPLGLAGSAHASPQTLDTSCASTGVVQDPLGFNDLAQAVAIQSDGKIVLAGHSDGVGFSDDMILIRYTTACARDTSFGSSGLVDIDASGGDRADEALAMKILPGGKFLLAGWRN